MHALLRVCLSVRFLTSAKSNCGGRKQYGIFSKQDTKLVRPKGVERVRLV